MQGTPPIVISRWRAPDTTPRITGQVMVLTAVAVAIVLQTVTAALMIHTAASTPDHTYASLAQQWDGQWFRQIAEHGYPANLPLKPNGHVAENPWAFYPLYPFTVRLVMTLLGTSFVTAGVLVSSAFTVLSVALMTVLLRPRFGTIGALATAALFCLWPAAPVLQMTYSESAGLAVVMAVLLAVDRGKWPWVIALAPLCAFARPISLPITAVLGALTLITWRASTVSERRWKVGATATYLAAAAVWPLTAWLVTGRATAYTDTEAAWRGGELLPFAGTIQNFQGVFGNIAGLLALALVATVTVVLLVGPASARLGLPLRLWAGMYLLYLAAGGGMFSSYPRLMYFAFPFAAIVAGIATSGSRGSAGRIAWVCLCASGLLVLQVMWAGAMLTGRPSLAP